MLAFDEVGEAFRLAYQLRWDPAGLVLEAQLTASKGHETRSLSLQADGPGRWRDAQGDPLPPLDGWMDIDIWPTPLKNSDPGLFRRVGLP